MPLVLNSPRASSLQPPVFLVDDHDEAYRLWRHHGIRRQTLLHFDAHIDFEWIADKDPVSVLKNRPFAESLKEFRSAYGWQASDCVNNFLHLGNYLCRALQEGMIREWYWIVPDPLWANSKTRRQIWHDLQNYYRFRTGPMTPPVKDAAAFRAVIYGVPLIVTTLHSLPEIKEPALLNIDVDYLTAEIFEKIPPPKVLRRGLPWIWPDELDAELSARGISSVMTTISHSVQGGFTPIQFKFFGEALKQFLGKESSANYPGIKEAYRFYAAEKNTVAASLLKSVEAEGTYEAARCYRLAEISYQDSKPEAAEEWMRLAVQADSEFASSYNSAARFYENLGCVNEAYEEHAMIRTLLPAQIEARIGEADFWISKGQCEAAEKRLLEIMDEDPCRADAALSLGRLYRRNKQFTAARECLSRALELQPKNIPARLIFARTLLALNDFEAAKKCLRETLGIGYHAPECYFLLAHAYLRLGFLKKSAGLWMEAQRLRLLIHWQNFRRG